MDIAHERVLKLAETPDSYGRSVRSADAQVSSQTAISVVSLASAYSSAASLVSRRIGVSHHILHGAPYIAGTRIPVYLILRKLEAGYDVAEITDMFEGLDAQDVRAAIRFAARVVETSPFEMHILTQDATPMEGMKWPPLYSDSLLTTTLSERLQSGSANLSQSIKLLQPQSTAKQTQMTVTS